VEPAVNGSIDELETIAWNNASLQDILHIHGITEQTTVLQLLL
jgi:hypothetical protein